MMREMLQIRANHQLPPAGALFSKLPIDSVMTEEIAICRVWYSH